MGAARTRAIAVIALSLLVVAGATGYALRGLIGHPAVNRHLPGKPAYAIGSVWDCPAGWPIKAYQPGGVYYPTYHPAAPSYEVRPERCFRSTAEANQAGFRLAPPPPGGTLVAGVYLMPTGQRLRDECLGAAGLVRFPVPCPTVLPAPAGGDLCPTAGCVSGGTFNMTVSYATSSPLDPSAPAPPAVRFAQLFLTAAPVSSDVGSLLGSCARPFPAPQILGHPVSWGTCSRGGDLIVSYGWTAFDANYEIQTREQSATSRSVIEYFAERLVEVASAGR